MVDSWSPAWLGARQIPLFKPALPTLLTTFTAKSRWNSCKTCTTLGCDWDCSSVLSNSEIVVDKSFFVSCSWYLALFLFVQKHLVSRYPTTLYQLHTQKESLWHFHDVWLFTHPDARLGNRDIISLDPHFLNNVYTSEHSWVRALS